MDDRWTALELELPPQLEGEALARLGEACLGVEAGPVDRARLRLVAYFRTRDEASKAERAVVVDLRRQDPGGAIRSRIEGVENGRWAERYQAALRPFDLGERFVVDPTASGAAPGGRIPISLVPGGAFGTGEHPTTRWCASALERHVRPGSRWADLGCGTGILSVVAFRCGAREVLAVDVDPVAVWVAREVVRLNHAAEAVRVERGSHEALGRAPRHGLVANIDGSYLVEHAGAMGECLAPGGLLLASGFLPERAGEVGAAFGRAGLEAVEEASLEGWCGMAGRRRGRRA